MTDKAGIPPHELTALVTGGSSGIGAALVAELEARGLRVYSVARSADKLAQQAEKTGSRVVPVVADVATPAGWQKVAEAVSAPLDFLVHNAGTLDPVTESVLFLTQKLLPVLRQPGARILAVSSGAAFRAIPGWAAYCTAKAAMNMVIHVFEAEWATARGIRSALVRPGVVDTPMQAHIRAQDAQNFPLVGKFRALKSDNALASPAEVAKFMADILLCTRDEDFARTLWDFYEKEELAHKMAYCHRKSR